MIHSGAVVAAGVSQGRSTSLKRDFKVCVFAESELLPQLFSILLVSSFKTSTVNVCVFT